jgi:ATP-grasp domain, R2K clade family 3
MVCAWGMIQFLYPSDPLNPKKPDETYAEEYRTAKAASFNMTLFSYEDFLAGTFRPLTPLTEFSVIYRGWMLSPFDYKRLYEAVSSKGATLLTSPEFYEYCHYLPRWYETLEDFTPETLFFTENDDIEDHLRTQGWTSCFLKDYVKSLSTDGGSIITDLVQIPTVIAKMKKYRGQIEGGLCARRLEAFDPATEQRYFVYQDEAFSVDGIIPEVVQEVVRRVSSPFFSVDIIQRSDGVWRVVELGDGQVSDLKRWTAEQFLKIFTS